MLDQTLEGQGIAHGAEAAHHPNRSVRQQRPMPKALTGMGVAQMQLHVGQCNAQQSITQRNRGVGVSAGIDQDPLAGSHRLMNALHQCPLKIALETVQGDPLFCRFIPKTILDGTQASMPIDPWFPLAQQVEIGSVQDVNRLCHGEGSCAGSSGKASHSRAREQDEMQVFVNGDPFEIQDDASVGALGDALSHLLRGFGGAEGQDGHLAAVALLGLDRLFHSDLVVEGGHVLERARVEAARARVDLGLGVGRGDALDAGDDLHGGLINRGKGPENGQA